MNTKLIQRYATTHRAIQNTSLPGYRQSFPKYRWFNEHPYSTREAGTVKLTLIQVAAVKIDRTAFSTELVLLAELSCTEVPAITSALLLSP